MILIDSFLMEVFDKDAGLGFIRRQFLGAEPFRKNSPLEKPL